VRSRLQALAVGTLGVLMVASSSSAHHVWAVDTQRSITVKGTVTGFDWGNPHVQIFLDAKDSNGAVEKWTAGGPSPTRMTGTGWDRNTLKVGDLITAIGHRGTDVPNLLRIQKVVLPDGRELVGYGSR
jgi:hypothetical protein